MPDLFEDMNAPDDAFALPGDDAVIAALPEVDDSGQPVERPRDESGRFAKAEPDTPTADEPVAEAPTDEPVAETAAETPEIDPSIGNVLAKFGIDPSDAALKLAQSFREQERLMGSQAQELGTERAQRQALEARLAAVEQQPVQQQGADYDVEALPEYFAQNPAQIGPTIERAWQLQDRTLLAHGLVALAEYDPAQAKQIEMEIGRRDAQAAAVAAAAPAREMAAKQHVQSVFAPAVAKDPDLLDFPTTAEGAALVAEFPTLERLVKSGQPEEQLEALVTLREIHRGREIANLKVSQAEIQRGVADQAQQAREEAFVASATTSSTGAKPSRAEEIAAEWAAERAPLEAGWNV